MHRVIILSFIFMPIILRSQVIDTVFVTDTYCSYSVTHRSSNGKVVGPVSYFDKEGVLFKSAVLKNGVGNMDETYYYPDGQLRLSVGYKKGLIHGRMTSYYPNQGIEWIKKYKQGKLNGESVAYDQTGRLFEGANEFLVPYSDIVVKTTCIKGRPDGTLVASFPDGRVSYTGQFYVGFAFGEFKYYDDSGALVRTELYKDGKFKGIKK